MMKEEEILERFTTKGGYAATLRLLRADDAPLLVDIFEHMSPASRYRRFNQSVDAVPPGRIWEEAQSIAGSDLERKIGVVALADLPDGPQTPIGAARLVETGPGQAEVALSVRDDLQNQGVGTRMLRKLACLARQHGYRELVASIRNDNPAVWQVFSRLPFVVTRLPSGAYSDIVVDLTRPQPSMIEPQLPAAT